MNLAPTRKLSRWVRRHWTPISWTAIGLGAVATVLLGMIGFQKNAATQQPPATYTLSTLFYLACQLFVVNSGGVRGEVGWELEVARFAGGLVTASAGVRLIATLHERWEDFRLRLCRNHVVVCGLDRKGRKLAEELLLAGEGRQSARTATAAVQEDVAKEHLPVVVIERNAQNDHLKSLAGLGAEVIVADAADEHILRKAGVHRARYLVAVTGNDETNIRIATIARKLAGELRSDGDPLQCRVHVVDARLLDLLKEEDSADSRKCDVRAFDMFANSARLVCDDHFLDPGVIRPDDPRTVHVVIVGLGKMGEAILVQVARTGQFANLRKPRITVIDPEACEKHNLLAARYPNLSLCCDVCFLDRSVHDPAVRQQLEQWAQDDAQVLSIAVCLDEDHRAMNCALHLPRAVAQRRVPVYVRLSEPHGFGSLLKGRPSEPRHLRCFGAPEDACTLERVLRPGIEELAKAIHAAYLEDENKKSPPSPAGPTTRPWQALSEHYKESNREQAEHMLWKLRTIGCRRVQSEQRSGQWATRLTEEAAEVLAKMEHLRWCAEKWLDGWQLGPVKSQEERTHPNLVPWEELSEADRDKDREPVRRICKLIGCRLCDSPCAAT